jgi:hypothetical protein
MVLYNRTNEMHFFSFIFDNNLYMFRIGKLFFIRRQFYMQRLVCIVLKMYEIVQVTCCQKYKNNIV